jgi:hypothetical protein
LCCLGKSSEGLRIAGKGAECLRIGHQRRHDLRLSGQGLKARTGGERTKTRIMDHELECVGLHQLGNRRVAKGDVLIPDLRGDIALRGSDCSCTRPERRIDTPEAIRTNTDGENRRGR